MYAFQKIFPPTQGEPIRIENRNVITPDQPIIPFISGDGIGPDVWHATQMVLDESVKKAYQGTRQISWFQIHAGLSALKTYGEDAVLPNDTIEAIKGMGPLTQLPLSQKISRDPSAEVILVTPGHEEDVRRFTKKRTVIDLLFLKDPLHDESTILFILQP